MVEPFYVLNSCYFIDINKAEVEFECKYPNECFWDFVEEIKKQDYIQEISIDGDLIITKDFTNLVQSTGLKDKYGKLIYEGDILILLADEGITPIKAVVEWEDDGYCVSYIDKVYKNDGSALINWHITERVIIGNIYENKELLGE